MAMTARDLLNELLSLEKEHADFDGLDVYLCVVDRKVYNQENADPPLKEMDDDFLAEGAAYVVNVVTGFDLSVTPMEELGDYILIRAVELETEES